MGGAVTIYKTDGSVLTDRYESVEAASKAGVSLAGANLAGADLTGAYLYLGNRRVVL